MPKPKEHKKPHIPIAKDPDRLSAPANRLASRLDLDTRICRQFVCDDRIPAGVAYWMEPSGQRVDRNAAEELIQKGHLVGLPDALFSDIHQSFGLSAE